nr:PREDICTED: H-2 class I histocompatibility antigen, alpha chain-like isoform X2 [Lepisosteus oculatus]
MRRWFRVLVPALLLCGAQLVPAVVRSLYYYGCGRPGGLEQPDVTVVGRLDGEEFSYYDSTQRNVTPRQGWVRQLEDPEGWKTNTRVLEAFLQIYRTAVRERQGSHTVLLLCGCELEEDGGGTSRGRCALGHEGKVYLRLDTRTRTWTQVSRAPGAEQGWEPDRSFNRTVLTFLEQYCSQWLKIFIKHTRKTLCRAPAPEAPGLQRGREPNSPVTCSVVSLFPGDVAVSWQRDGQELTEGVDPAVVLPNGDGSFQVRRSLRVSEEELERHSFTCFVNGTSLGEELVIPWSKREKESGPGLNTGQPLHSIEPSSQNVWMADKNTIFVICTTAFYVLIAALVICCVTCESGFFKKSTRHQPSAAQREGHTGD